MACIPCECTLRPSAAAMAAMAAAAAAVGMERSSENCGSARGHLTRSRDPPFPGKSMTPRVTCGRNAPAIAFLTYKRINCSLRLIRLNQIGLHLAPRGTRRVEISPAAYHRAIYQRGALPS